MLPDQDVPVKVHQPSGGDQSAVTRSWKGRISYILPREEVSVGIEFEVIVCQPEYHPAIDDIEVEAEAECQT